MKYRSQDVINEARGFLKALRLFCEPRTTMWINSFKMKHDFESTVEWYIKSSKKYYQCKSIKHIKKDELYAIIEKCIFDKLFFVKDASLKKILRYEFEKFYCMAAFIDIENNMEKMTYPLIQETSVLLELESDEYEITACFLTPIGSRVVVTTIGKVKINDLQPNGT